MLEFQNGKTAVIGTIRKSIASDLIDISNILKDVFGADLHTDRSCCYREIAESDITAMPLR